MKRLLAIPALIAIFWMVGCETAPPLSTSSSSPLPQPAPSYAEKVRTFTVNQAPATACPTDEKWQSLEWKLVVPLINACVQAKDWNKVEKMGNHLAIHAHLTPWGAYFMSLSAEARKDYPRALWLLELALKKDPNEGLFHYEMGRIHWDMKVDEEAIRQFKMASDLNPSLVEAHDLVGQMALQRQDYSVAKSEYEKSLKVDSKHLAAHLGLASVALSQKDWGLAEDHLHQVVLLNPRATKARLVLAQLQEEHLQKLTEALQTYKELRRLSAEKKLDESLTTNLDSKIQTLEKAVSQAGKASAVSSRTPTGERQVHQ